MKFFKNAEDDQEKALAARRARVKTVIVPARNRNEVAELPEAVTRDGEIRLADTVREAVDAVLLPIADCELRNKNKEKNLDADFRG